MYTSSEAERTTLCHGTNYPVPWHEVQCAMARTTLCHFCEQKKMAQFQNTTNLRYKPTCAMARSTMCHGTKYNVPWHEVVGLFVPLAVHVGVQRLACARSHTVVSAMASGFILRVGGYRCKKSWIHEYQWLYKTDWRVFLQPILPWVSDKLFQSCRSSFILSRPGCITCCFDNRWMFPECDFCVHHRLIRWLTTMCVLMYEAMID